MAPRIHHFIVRPEVVRRLPTGLTVEQSLVPLIPLDELPEWFEITGVPRSLAPEQTAGLSNLGCYERQGVHGVEIVIDEPESDAGMADTPETTGSAGAGETPVVGDEKPQPGLQHSRWADQANDNDTPGKPKAATSGAVHPAARTTTHVVSPASATSSIPHPGPAAAPAHPQQASPTSPSPHNTPPKSPKQAKSDPPTPGSSTEPKKRVYCRHWIRHGTCKWGPYCRFAHAMPATLSGLAEAGLRDFPGWWTAAVGFALASAAPGRKVDDYVRMNGVSGLGYGYGMSGFVPYAPAAPGFVGFGRKEREGRDREVHPREAERGARKLKVEARLEGVMPGMKMMGEDVGGVGQFTCQGGRGQVPPVATGSGPSQALVVAQGSVGSVTDGGEREIRASEQYVPQDAPVQQMIPQQSQQKPVDV